MVVVQSPLNAERARERLLTAWHGAWNERKWKKQQGSNREAATEMPPAAPAALSLWRILGY
eukprot:1409036-Pyramimonas_sp.AAC.1